MKFFLFTLMTILISFNSFSNTCLSFYKYKAKNSSTAVADMYTLQQDMRQLANKYESEINLVDGLAMQHHEAMTASMHRYFGLPREWSGYIENFQKAYGDNGSVTNLNKQLAVFQEGLLDVNALVSKLASLNEGVKKNKIGARETDLIIELNEKIEALNWAKSEIQKNNAAFNEYRSNLENDYSAIVNLIKKLEKLQDGFSLFVEYFNEAAVQKPVHMVKYNMYIGMLYGEAQSLKNKSVQLASIKSLMDQHMASYKMLFDESNSLGKIDITSLLSAHGIRPSKAALVASEFETVIKKQEETIKKKDAFKKKIVNAKKYLVVGALSIASLGGGKMGLDYLQNTDVRIIQRRQTELTTLQPVQADLLKKYESQVSPFIRQNLIDFDAKNSILTYINNRSLKNTTPADIIYLVSYIPKLLETRSNTAWSDGYELNRAILGLTPIRAYTDAERTDLQLAIKKQIETWDRILTKDTTIGILHMTTTGVKVDPNKNALYYEQLTQEHLGQIAKTKEMSQVSPKLLALEGSTNEGAYLIQLLDFIKQSREIGNRDMVYIVDKLATFSLHSINNENAVNFNTRMQTRVNSTFKWTNNSDKEGYAESYVLEQLFMKLNLDPISAEELKAIKQKISNLKSISQANLVDKYKEETIAYLNLLLDDAVKLKKD
ncbi:MAG: hypothetical protein JNL11_09615 [Bdellovibrionaceae bacterium]|nr:hypothetical protein [Pseudobdellovibrionaceae bacterium]